MLRFTIASGLICGLMLLGCQSKPSQPPAAAASPAKPVPAKLVVDPPVTKDNLTVWLVHGPDRSGGRTYLTLSEAMAQKKLIVHETGNVNQLAVENVGDQTVFIPAGSIVKGGQQDRTLGSDLIITKADGKVPIDAFCVEHGRWSRRGSEDVLAFSANTHMVAGKEMKLASNAATTQPSQQEVWASVAKAQQRLQKAAAEVQSENARNIGGAVMDATSASSFQLSLETDAVKKLTEGRKQALIDAPKGQPDVVGYVYAVNGKIAGGNVYASPALFRKLWPMLLDSAVVESVTENPTTQPATPAALPSRADVAATLADREKVTNTRQVNGRTTVNAYDAADSVMTETIDTDGVPVSRTVLAK